MRREVGTFHQLDGPALAAVLNQWHFCGKLGYELGGAW
jgi:hypothetical protein